MMRIWRLLRYLRPYMLYSVVSVVTMAVVGAMATFRILLIKPIIDNVLRPKTSPDRVLEFTIPHSTHKVNLQWLLPHHFHNAWTVVAVALVGSAILKSVCDYTGTLLANKAGFGMITDLRNDLYDSLLRRSTAFFQRHATGRVAATVINDVERVQAAMAPVMSDFLQQFFTLIFMIAAVILVGGARRAVGRTSWPRSRTSCTKRSRATASSRRSAWNCGRWTASAARPSGCSPRICARWPCSPSLLR